MKKITFLMAIIVFFVSCKKENKDDLPPPQAPVVPITLVRSPGNPDQSITAPQSGILFQEHRLRVTMDSFRISSIQPAFSLESGSFTSGILDSLFMTVVDSATNTLPFNGASIVKTPVTATTTLSFNPHLFLSKGTYLVRVYSSIRSATPRIIKSQLSITYWQGLATSPVTLTSAGATTTVVVNNVSTAVATTTPPSLKVSGNQKVETLHFTVRSSGSSATLSTVKVQVADAVPVQSVEVLDGSTVIGNAPFSGTQALVPVSASLHEGVTKTFSVRLQLKPVSLGQSGKNVKTSISVDYQTDNGDFRSNDTLRTGNDVLVYKAIPSITLEPVSRVITNGTRMNFFIVRVAAPIQGDVAIAQLGFPIGFADLGTDSVQILGQPMLFVDNVNMTASTRFLNQVGDSISSTGSFPETTTKILFNEKTSAGEYIVPAGAVRRFIVSFIPRGFNPAEFDAVSGTLGGDTPTTYTNLNLGTGGWDLKLFSSSGQHAGALRVSLLWSDRNAVNHSASPIFSSADWYNGDGVYTPSPATVFQR